MDTTSISLLDQLKRPAGQNAWDRFVQLYTPLLYLWARRLGARDQEADDLVQDVFTILVQKLPQFVYNRDKRFRGWLWTITLNKWREQRRQPARDQAAGDALNDLPGPDNHQEVEDAEYRQYIARRALELMRSDFQESTWQACWELVVERRPAQNVADELGLGIDAVYAAKSRVLRRLRQELAGLLE